jgi:MinD superfamily P-loop ATPase
LIRELVVVSGKGGTGKTSITACLALLANRPVVVADCDVDASDLHLLLTPDERERHDFHSGHLAVIAGNKCIGCGLCHVNCGFGAVGRVDSATGDPVFFVDPMACQGCGVCVRFCPAGAVDFPERHCGHWMVSDTRAGVMVHARLGPAGENSGKLVSTVRREARRLAAETGSDLVIADGPPGTGCPVIASITGATMVLAVTEPTVSGEHDLERVLSLSGHFGIPAVVCVNKWDLNPEMAERIEKMASGMNAFPAGRIRYDPEFTRAQMLAKTVIDTEAPGSEDIRCLWKALDL